MCILSYIFDLVFPTLIKLGISINFVFEIEFVLSTSTGNPLLICLLTIKLLTIVCSARKVMNNKLKYLHT